MKARVPLSVALVAIVIAAGFAAYLGHRVGSSEAGAPASGVVNVTGRAHPWPRLPRYQKDSGWAALPARRHPAPVVTTVSSELGESASEEPEIYEPSEEPTYVPPAEPTPSSSGGGGSGGSSGTREFGVTYTH